MTDGNQYLLPQYFMQRCLDLARLGAGHVAPNPMVGAVLVYEDRIIGEGYHQRYGEAHAEVNCIGSVQEKDLQYISAATMYVSLEPCAHFGKTPPCADLIIRHKIPRVIIGCPDPFKEVDGRGIQKLEAAGVKVTTGILEQECRELNKRFFTFHEQKRPYIILKWAETGDGFLANIAVGSVVANGEQHKGNGSNVERLLISNEYTNRLVHQWRSEEAAILVGTNTASMDDPDLTNRLWDGPSPVRLVIDRELKLSTGLKLFNGKVRTIVFNLKKHEEKENLLYYRLDHTAGFMQEMMKALVELNIQSVLVEGGAGLLNSFIEGKLWDEVRVIANNQLMIGEGLPAPQLNHAKKIDEQKIFSDRVVYYKPVS